MSWSTLAGELGGATVHVTQDVSPFARRRGDRARKAFDAAGIELRSHEGLNAVDVRTIETGQGKPYTVFSPFHRKWLETPRRDVLSAPSELPALPSRLAKGRLPSLASLGLAQEVAEPAPGGEAAARRTLDRFLDGPIAEYTEAHDALGADRTSRLSPYLHFGSLSVRSIEERLPRGEGPEAFRRQLCWRDFHHHVLHHFPRNARSEFQAALPRQDQVELRGEALRGVVRGPHRLPAGRRRDAPAAARGLDAQPRPARRRLVSHQGPGDRLALGRALVHAAADRRRRGQQQRQLAVDRLGRHRPAARVSADLQPGSPPGALRPRERLRAALRPRARARCRAGTCASRGRCPTRSSARSGA